MSSHEEALGPEVPLPVDFLLGSTSEPPDTIVGSESGIPVDWKGRDSSCQGRLSKLGFLIFVEEFY